MVHGDPPATSPLHSCLIISSHHALNNSATQPRRQKESELKKRRQQDSFRSVNSVEMLPFKGPTWRHAHFTGRTARSIGTETAYISWTRSTMQSARFQKKIIPLWCHEMHRYLSESTRLVCFSLLTDPVNDQLWNRKLVNRFDLRIIISTIICQSIAECCFKRETKDVWMNSAWMDDSMRHVRSSIINLQYLQAMSCLTILLYCRSEDVMLCLSMLFTF